MKKTILALTISFIGLTLFAQNTFEDFNIRMMSITYKIETVANGSKNIGTCFIIGKPSNKISEFSFYAMVTAKHNLEGSDSDYLVLHLRKQIKEDEYLTFEQSIRIRENNNNLWVSHDDNNIDIAAMYVSLPDSINFKLMPMDILATDDYLKYIEFHPGDKVFLLGYPYDRMSPRYNFPILTSGIISSYPLYPANLIKNYLIDINVYSGNSGGPVFLYETGRVFGEGIHFDRYTAKIIGILTHEMFQEKIYDYDEEINTKRRLMKIAYVVPSQLIIETINKLPQLD